MNEKLFTNFEEFLKAITEYPYIFFYLKKHGYYYQAVISLDHSKVYSITEDETIDPNDIAGAFSQNANGSTIYIYEPNGDFDHFDENFPV